MLRFLAVGLGNTAFGYSVYALAVVAGLTPQLALILQFVLGVLWNYTLHARLVFSVNGWTRFPLYIGAYLLIYTINATSLRILLAEGIGPLLAQLLILPFIVALSWLLIGRVMGFRHVGRVR
ncbi:MAG: GtrA family protein [Nitratireductor sp.]|nr:GtrA family protein [Nitratireductor sp.]